MVTGQGVHIRHHVGEVELLVDLRLAVGDGAAELGVSHVYPAVGHGNDDVRATKGEGVD